MASRTVSTIVNAFTMEDSKFSISISVNGDVYSFGKSTCGAHGHSEQLIMTPTKIRSLVNIKALDCGSYHTLCLDFEGNVFGFGKNDFGQLGIGEQSDSFFIVPQKIDLPVIKQVSCGDQFSICVSEDGIPYSFGWNITWQLGLGNNENYNTPQIIECLNNVDFVECGGKHVICKTKNNEVFGWGSNFKGQLGSLDDFVCIPSKLEFPDDVVDIKCGSDFVLVLLSNGDVLSCGSNTFGELGREGNNSKLEKVDGLSEIVRIACGKYFSLCIDASGNLFVFGSNPHGQLGIPGKTSVPIKHPSLSNIIDISSRGLSSFVKTSSNEIYAFGHNEQSQLGVTTKDIKQFNPIRVLENNEDIWCSNITNQSKAKSARPINITHDSPPKKKQKK